MCANNLPKVVTRRCFGDIVYIKRTLFNFSSTTALALDEPIIVDKNTFLICYKSIWTKLVNYHDYDLLIYLAGFKSACRSF